jgi:hypothetical protein
VVSWFRNFPFGWHSIVTSRGSDTCIRLAE